jgi:hypothetical protein
VNAVDPMGLLDTPNGLGQGASEDVGENAVGIGSGYSGEAGVGGPGPGGDQASGAQTDPGTSLSRLFSNGPPTASELREYAESQGWKLVEKGTGPEVYVDENGVQRMTIKEGSARTPGSEHPHVELRNAQGQRINPDGDPVTRRSPGNHTPIVMTSDIMSC